MPKTWKDLLKNIQSRISTVKTSLTVVNLCPVDDKIKRYFKSKLAV